MTEVLSALVIDGVSRRTDCVCVAIQLRRLAKQTKRLVAIRARTIRRTLAMVHLVAEATESSASTQVLIRCLLLFHRKCSLPFYISVPVYSVTYNQQIAVFGE